MRSFLFCTQLGLKDIAQDKKRFTNTALRQQGNIVQNDKKLSIPVTSESLYISIILF